VSTTESKAAEKPESRRKPDPELQAMAQLDRIMAEAPGRLARPHPGLARGPLHAGGNDHDGAGQAEGAGQERHGAGRQRLPVLR
jgi:hypothetical protein